DGSRRFRLPACAGTGCAGAGKPGMTMETGLKERNRIEMKQESGEEALDPVERQRRIAWLRRLVAEEVERRRARGEPMDGDWSSAGGPDNPHRCARTRCRRKGTCRPPRGRACVNDPAEAMRREI